MKVSASGFLLSASVRSSLNVAGGGGGRVSRPAPNSMGDKFPPEVSYSLTLIIT